MRPLTAQWIADAVDGRLAAPADVTVTSAWNDTRTLAPGALYVAIRGEVHDGHDFVAAAVEAGAVLTLADRAVDAPHVLVEDVPRALGVLAKAYLALLRAEGDLTVIGITGSNGKTTTKDLLVQVLPDAHAPIRSYNDATGLPLTVLGAELSTRHLILEMGASAPGDLAYLTSIAPLDIAVVLMVGTAHAAGYGSPDALAEEKASILDGLVPGGVAILNADDHRVAAMAPGGDAAHAADARSARISTVFFGTTAAHGHQAVGLTDDRGRASFAIGSLPRRTLALVGEHHVTNALAAFSVAVTCGLDGASAWEAIAAAKPLSAHRMALTERADGVFILDDAYNASPESMRAAMRALRAVAGGGRTFAVIGEMRELGNESIRAHDAIGVDAVRLGIDHLVVVGEGARPAYVSAVREGSWGDEAAYVATIDEARALVEGRVAPGDTVLVKASHGSGLWRLADELIGDDA